MSLEIGLTLESGILFIANPQPSYFWPLNDGLLQLFFWTAPKPTFTSGLNGHLKRRPHQIAISLSGCKCLKCGQAIMKVRLNAVTFVHGLQQ